MMLGLPESVKRELNVESHQTPRLLRAGPPGHQAGADGILQEVSALCASRASVTAALAELGLELELSGWVPWRLARTRDRMDPGV
jgi:hypothetical protein